MRRTLDGMAHVMGVESPFAGAESGSVVAVELWPWPDLGRVAVVMEDRDDAVSGNVGQLVMEVDGAAGSGGRCRMDWADLRGEELVEAAGSGGGGRYVGEDAADVVGSLAGATGLLGHRWLMGDGGR
ncbi:hypothetical protein ACLOJK_024197 [Asimina triloba]